MFVKKNLVSSLLAIGLVSSSFLTTLPAVSFAQAGEVEPVGPKLTPKLKELLKQEMQAISTASQEIMMAIATGKLAAVAAKARNIHDSFIMKKSLTDQDKKDLMGAVPPHFVTSDRLFHVTAGKLAHAAESGDMDLVHYYFGQMNRACSSCHSDYATDRFPDFPTAPTGVKGH